MRSAGNCRKQRKTSVIDEVVRSSFVRKILSCCRNKGSNWRGSNQPQKSSSRRRSSDDGVNEWRAFLSGCWPLLYVLF